jgi:tetratricopeptide (TPR) repeat protein
MARLFAEKYNQADATDAISAGLAINPQSADLHALRAQLALEQFDLATARSSVERALAICPKHTGAHRARADILLADVRPAEAIDILEEARKFQPHDEETLGRLAAAYAAVDGMPGGKPAARMQALINQVAKANPHCGTFYLAAGDAFDRMRRFPLAAEQFRRAQEKMPQLVQARGKLGMTLMRLGEEAEAATLLDEAFTIDPFNVRVKNTLEVLDLLDGYAILETEHFVLKFDRGSDELLTKYAARYLERDVYPQLALQFGFKPEGKTLIEIFSRHKNTGGHGWFSARMVGLPAIGTVGACAGRMIALTSPDELPKKFDWARVLRHEYVHVLNLQQTDFCIPHWFTEGLAVRSEGDARPRSWNEILARRAREEKLFDLDSLTFGFVRPASSDDWSLAYCQAALHVDYLHDKFGPNSVAGMLAAYAERKSTADAIEQALGISQADYEQGYRQYVNDYLAKQGLGNMKDTPSLADLEKAATEEGAGAAPKAALARAHLDRKNYPEARRWAIAARQEDEKQPLAAYVLARLQLSIGDTQAALELLEKSLDVDRPEENHLALLAAMKLQVDNWAEAERLHLIGQKHFPAADRWLKGLARVDLSQQDDAKLAGVLEKLAELEPESRSFRKKLAELALQRRDFQAARRWSRQLIHLDLKDADAHAQLATAAQGLADVALAAEEYETAVTLQPDRKDWRFAWAGVLAELRKKDDARRVAEELKQQDDDYPGIDALLEKLKRE